MVTQEMQTKRPVADAESGTQSLSGLECSMMPGLWRRPLRRSFRRRQIRPDARKGLVIINGQHVRTSWHVNSAFYKVVYHRCDGGPQGLANVTSEC
jgi:hypothetical protein